MFFEHPTEQPLAPGTACGEPSDPAVVLGPPVGVSPFSCRPQKQSPNLAVPAPPEWWSKVTLPDIPIERPWEVQAALERMLATPKQRARLKEALRRSGASAPHVIAALAERKMPRALVAVPLLESAYSDSATSKAGAVGLWQLMPATAKKLGMAVTRSYDERRNPERATVVALDHLAHLYSRFGSWDLALAAYDRGEGGVHRAMKKHSVGDYWSLVDLMALPGETRSYVPAILALAIIYENVDRFDLDGPRAALRAVASLDVPAGTPLSLIARAAGTSIMTLRRTSPELVSCDVIPNIPNPYVSIPAGGVSRARVMLPSLLAAGLDPLTASAPQDFDWGRDEVVPHRSEHRSPKVPKRRDGSKHELP